MNGDQEATVDKAVATGLRVDAESVRKKIVHTEYHHFPNTCHTVCLIKMQNGHTITGESCCVDVKNFNAAEGKHWALQDAVNKACDKEAYLLSQRLFTFGE